GTHPAALVGNGLGVATGGLGQSGGPGMAKGVWLDQPQARTAPSTLQHLPSTMCAQSISCMLPDELDQDEIRLGKRPYPVVVLGKVLVVAGNHRKACTANGAPRDDAVDYRAWESGLRTGAVGVDSLDDVDVWPFALATRMVFPEVQIAEPESAELTDPHSRVAQPGHDHPVASCSDGIEHRLTGPVRQCARKLPRRSPERKRVRGWRRNEVAKD